MLIIVVIIIKWLIWNGNISPKCCRLYIQIIYTLQSFVQLSAARYTRARQLWFRFLDATEIEIRRIRVLAYKPLGHDYLKNTRFYFKWLASCVFRQFLHAFIPRSRWNIYENRDRDTAREHTYVQEQRKTFLFAEKQNFYENIKRRVDKLKVFSLIFATFSHVNSNNGYLSGKMETWWEWRSKLKNVTSRNSMWIIFKAGETNFSRDLPRKFLLSFSLFSLVSHSLSSLNDRKRRTGKNDNILSFLFFVFLDATYLREVKQQKDINWTCEKSIYIVINAMIRKRFFSWFETECAETRGTGTACCRCATTQTK